nr:triose-phosphate isomerase [uncultured Sphingorhabdus sp.]
MRKFVIGNWKMNGTSADLNEIAAIAQMAARYPAVDSGLCLPATLISRACQTFAGFVTGGQDCHMESSGAHTGCVSATMLVDAGASIVIVGHSERRAAQHETNGDVQGKAKAALASGLKVIVCVGETLAERENGNALEVVLGQVAGSIPDTGDLSSLNLAYEPVWAIGTGLVPALSDVEEMHGAIRDHLVERFGETGKSVRILYGGSMNGDNAADLLSVANVDGGLIGGASLSAAKFEPILAAAQSFSE